MAPIPQPREVFTPFPKNADHDVRGEKIGRFRVDFYRWQPRHAQILVFKLSFNAAIAQQAGIPSRRKRQATFFCSGSARAFALASRPRTFFLINGSQNGDRNPQQIKQRDQSIGKS